MARPMRNAGPPSWMNTKIHSWPAQVKYAAVSTTPGTGYQVRSAQLSPEDTEAISQNTCLSRPSRSARTAPSAVDAQTRAKL